MSCERPLLVPAPICSGNIVVADYPSLGTKKLGVEEGENHIGNYDAEHDLHEQLRRVLVAQAVLEAGAAERVQQAAEKAARRPRREKSSARTLKRG